MTLRECEEVMEMICNKLEAAPCNIIIREFKRKSNAYYHRQTKTIHLRVRAVSEPQSFHCVRRTKSLLHELAHHIVYCRFGRVGSPHGKEFVSVLVEVVKVYYGEDNADSYLWANEYKCVLRRYAQMSRRSSGNHREAAKAARRATLQEAKAVKDALLKAGIPVTRVIHGRVTGCLLIYLNCESWDAGQELKLNAIKIAQELTGRSNEDCKEIFIM